MANGQEREQEERERERKTGNSPPLHTLGEVEVRIYVKFERFFYDRQFGRSKEH